DLPAFPPRKIAGTSARHRGTPLGRSPIADHSPQWYDFGSLLPQEGDMASAALPHDRKSARIAMVERHVELENAHDLEGVLGTFGNQAHYDDEAWGDHYTGRDGVRAFYEQLMAALPDLEIEVLKRHVAEENIVLEVMIRGTQMGTWRGLPPTGQRVEVP